MRFTFLVEVEVERETGKFASRDEVAEQLQSELEGADPGSIQAGEDGEYNVTSWSVEEQPQEKPKRTKKVVTPSAGEVLDARD